MILNLLSLKLKLKTTFSKDSILANINHVCHTRFITPNIFLHCKTFKSIVTVCTLLLLPFET